MTVSSFSTIPILTQSDAERDGQSAVSEKTCTKCRQTLPITAFGWMRTVGRYRGACRVCENVRNRTPTDAGPRACVTCHGPIPKGRHGTTCKRECLLESVGLPVTFDALHDLDLATEDEVRDTLNAVLLAARVKSEVGA